jgi:hypothetical protein
VQTLHNMKLLSLTIGLTWLTSAVLPAADYYIDAQHGDDAAAGLCPDTAWSSLAAANAKQFEPGDVIRLRSGQVFSGQFRPQNSGAVGKPITLTSYLDGPKPVIAAGGATRSAVFLENLSHWVVEGIEITNTGAEPKAKRVGLLIFAKNAGLVKDITLKNLFVRDVNGLISKDKGGGTGIRWEVDTRKEPTKIDGLLIEDCHILRCDRDAIKGWMDPWDDLSHLSTNVVIRGNLLEDIGGDGIVPIGTESALIEYNRIYGARQRIEDLDTKKATQYAGPSIGIWPWSSMNTQIRFNEVWGYAGTFDGQGLDSDFNCDGTVFEYNLSADNAGGFFLICDWSKHQDSGQSIGNKNTVIRHNISFNDHLRGFVLNGPVSGVKIYENIVYNTIEREYQLIVDTPWEAGRFADSVEVRGNLFYTTGKAKIFQGTWDGSGMGLWKYQKPINQKRIRFSGNAYSNIVDHEEEGMQTLDSEETLGSLIERLKVDAETSEGFDRMSEFLKDSRYWSEIEKAL